MKKIMHLLASGLFAVLLVTAGYFTDLNAAVGSAYAQSQETGQQEQPASDNDAAATQQPAAQPGTAQSTVTSALPSSITLAIGKAVRTASDITTELDSLKQKLANRSLPQSELAQVRQQLGALRDRANASDAELNGPLSQLDQLVGRLGAAPKEGESEPDSVAAERKALNEVRDRLLGARARLAVAAGATEQLGVQAGEIERERFTASLLKRDKSPLQPSLWSQGLVDLGQLWTRTTVLFKGIYTRATEQGSTGTLWFLIAAFFVLFIAGYRVCRIIAYRIRSDIENPSELNKLARVVAVPVGYALTALACVLIFWTLYTSSGLADPRLERLYVAFASALIGYAFARGAARSILSPGRADWRIASLGDAAASRWLAIASLGFLLIAAHVLLGGLSEVLNIDNGLAELRKVILAVFLIAIIAQLVLIANRDRRRQAELETAQPARRYFGWASYAIQPVWLLVIGAAIALVAGYLTLSVYVLGNIVVIGVVISFLYCVRQMADAFVTQSISDGSRVSQVLQSAFSMSDRGIKRAGIVLNAVVDISLVLLGLPLLLAMSALTWVDVRSWISSAFFGFKVGDITISLSSVLLALGVFAVGLFMTRFVTSWLDRRILAPTDMDSGVRNSIRTGAGYIAIILALLIAFAAAGVDFGNIAIVAGALSVGIGFGLQSIVNNFVSGLILLAERPIKVGDWVQTSAGEGTVRRINVRSTEIETFDRCSIIVPNSSLISESVSNWTHGDLMGRCKVSVGVSYDADPQQVHDILMKCAQEHPRALPFPQASVLFQNFGDNSLDFDLRVFIDDVNWVAFVASELRFTIHKELKTAGIEIPFPQRDVYVKGLGEAVQITAPATPEPKPAAKKPARKRAKK